jgi:hypothetical protein
MKERDIYESQNMGHYRRVFPHADPVSFQPLLHMLYVGLAVEVRKAAETLELLVE